MDPKCDLHVGDTKIKQVRKFRYLGSVMPEDGKSDAEIRRHIGMAKDAFQKLGRDRRSLLVTKKRVLNYYMISVLLYGSECWTVSSKMNKRLKATEVWFYKKIP